MDKKDLAYFAEDTHRITAKLMALVPDDKLDWHPVETEEWWSTGQLLHHLTYSTGTFWKGVLRGQWPDDGDTEQTNAAEHPSVSTVAEALEKLEANRALVAQLLDELPEDDFRDRMYCGPRIDEPDHPEPLGNVLHYWVLHQVRHQAVLLTYLKLLGIRGVNFWLEDEVADQSTDATCSI